MAHIVIIGASTGGMPTAYEIKAAVGPMHRVTVISNTDTFHFVPSNPWVAVGWRSRKDTTFAIGPALNKKGIEFIAVGAQHINPAEKQVILADGQVVNYDCLVIATGPKLAFDEVPGLGPQGFTQSVCTINHAEEAYERWQQFTHDPGPIVVGAVQGASCFGPAYEFAFIMNTDLRRKKIRDRVPMTFVTAEPYIGHLGLGGVGDSKGLMEHELRQNDIKWITNAKVTRVEAGMMFVTEHNEKGEVIKEHQLPFKFSMMLPAFKGVDAVAALGDQVVNPRGFIKVDKYQRNPTWQNIYAVGVCIAIPPRGSNTRTYGCP